MSVLHTQSGDVIQISSSTDKTKFLRDTCFIIWGVSTWGVYLYRKSHKIGNDNVVIWDRNCSGDFDYLHIEHPTPELASDVDKALSFVVLAFTIEKNILECNELLRGFGFKNVVILDDLLLFIKKQGINSKTIKLGFYDYYRNSEEFDVSGDYFYSLLRYSDNLNVIYDKSNPDYALCGSNYGLDKLSFDGIRVKVSSELHGTNFEIFDYNISFHDLVYGDRYFQRLCYVPIVNMIRIATMRKRALLHKNRFCHFLYSNSGVMSRNSFFGKLRNRSGGVDSYGNCLKNTTVAMSHNGSRELLKSYKFGIAFENAVEENYVTEKIVNTFLDCVVPIYYGAPNIAQFFNPKAFINCHEFVNFDEAIEHVIAIDKDDEMYAKMIHEPFVTQEQMKKYLENEDQYEDFLLNIFYQDYWEAFRRPRYKYKTSIEHYVYNNQECIAVTEPEFFASSLIFARYESTVSRHIAQCLLSKQYNFEFFAEHGIENVAILWNCESILPELIADYISNCGDIRFRCYISIDRSSAETIKRKGYCYLSWNELEQLDDKSVIICCPNNFPWESYDFKYFRDFFKTVTDAPVETIAHVLGVET